MAQWFSRLREQVANVAEDMSPGRRLAVASAAGLVLVGLLAVVLWVANPSYAILFSNLTPEDAGEIVAVLRDGGVPYRLQDGGSTISVPADRVYETRLQIAAQGLPRGGIVGFEIFLETSLGATDFDQLVKYNMALQGELTRTIRELAGVLDARVHIVMPERRLFVRDERPATASVFLQLRPGAQLDAQQVRGITNLIARSVEGLSPENITIVDNWGRVLSDLASTAAGFADGTGLQARLDIQRAYERELELRVQTMLEAVYGREHVIVRVNAALNFDMEEHREDRFEPVVRDAGVVRSSQLFEEESSSGGPAGVVGVDANIPGFVADAPAEGAFSRREEILNFELNRIESVRVQAPGRLDRLSVGVWIDGELDPVEQRRVESVVAATLGFDENRGDTVIVESMPFAAAPAAELPVLETVVVPMWVWIVGAALVLALVLALLSGRARRAAVSVPEIAVTVDDDFEPETPIISTEDVERQKLRERAVALAQEKPREAAQLVKVWLTEG